MATQQIIRRGILQSFNAASYTASVLIIEATNYVLQSVPISTSVDGTSAIAGAACAVLFFDETNYTDGVIIAVYGSAPSPTPGRVIFTTPVCQINAQTINNGVTSTFPMSGMPAGVLGIVYRLTMSTSTAGAFIYAGPHGATISNYAELDNPGVPGALMNIGGILPVDTNGKIDIQANGGNCVVTLFTFGYVL